MLVSDLFTARCLDLNITTVNTKLRENFMLASSKIFKGTTLNFSNLNFGPECAKIASKIISVYTWNTNYKSESLKSPQSLCCSKINLSNNNFGIQNLKILIRVWINQPRLIHLNLQNNDIDDLTMWYLFKNLQTNITIIHLDIGNSKMAHRNRIRKRSSLALKWLLTVNKSLQILNLQNWGINFITFENIINGVAQSELISLNISQNDINDEWILILNEKYSSVKYKLQELVLNHVPVVDKSAMKREKYQMVGLSEVVIIYIGCRKQFFKFYAWINHWKIIFNQNKSPICRN